MLTPIGPKAGPSGGPADASPYINQVVTTNGIVTGVGSYGYFMQSGDGQWNGVWVYSGSVPSVQVGDDITLTGPNGSDMTVELRSAAFELPSLLN